ncbi:uncharacterized protein KIAA0825 homolog [Lampris incognitus]|uniref:uncharacterized protein KIAA0825 homolog n=1 Tax=Lampris incognitus TaxID=2546036 RepID=UPI0024B5FDFC|nr:uncharacterized protein KIAA0825 homolog [Lampris incognitus]
MEWPGDFPYDHAFVELLVPGLSNELDIQQLLQDTEEKLKLNSCSIEQNLKDLQAKMGDSWMGERPPSPTECLQWFNLRAANSVRPLTTGHQDLMEFFRALQQYLRSGKEGREETTLQLLLNLSSQFGVSFPCTPSSSSLKSQQTVSSIPVVHVVKDNASLEVQEAWDDVRFKLRCHLLGRLSSRITDNRGHGRLCSLSVCERIRCLQQLCFLYPESEVFTHYQGLRSQSVIALLHSALSSSSGSDTGFGRLSVGLRSVAPVLTQAIKEDLHVLSRLAEPHTILGFLNTAYLSTVAQELASMMARESETALKDNTTLSGKIKKYSAMSRASVAPMELPKKARSFNLTSHQLGALTQLVCTLLGLESSVEELAVNVALIRPAGETPCVKGILKKTREDSPVTPTVDGSKITSETLLRTPEVLAVHFDWRSAFRGLVPQMAHCVKVVLDDVCTKSLQHEEVLHASGGTLISLSTTAGHAPISISSDALIGDSSHPCSDRETPTMVAEFCGVIMAEVDALLPLALACRDGPLLEVRSNFVDVCAKVTTSMLVRLEERALEVPSTAPFKNLPALLATCIYVQQKLEHYHARLWNSTATGARVPLTLLPIQKYQEMTEALRDQLTGYCVRVCSTSILHDAESHHWMDPKPFYEGERCSFSVQMWFYFLCGLRSDLWTVLPAELAKEVLAQVLCETLQLLVRRYASVQPSYKRHQQIRCDITAVLLYVEQLMWSVCDSAEALVHSSCSSSALIMAEGCDWSSQIHSLCDQLLTVMVIVTAPLPMLHGTFLSSPVRDPMQYQLGSNGKRWINAINPDLFTEQSIQEGLTGRAATQCHLRLLTSDPGSSPRLLLRLLLDGDCHLPKILLENSHFCVDSSLEVSPKNSKAGDDFMVVLFSLLCSLNDVPKALTQALEPYLDRRHIWEHLYMLADTTRTVPVLVSCVRDVITKSIHSLLRHTVSIAMAWQTTEEPKGALFRRSPPESILAKIPKVWNYTPVEPQGKEAVAKGVISLAVQALSFLFTNLPLAVASIPLSVRFLFHVAERRLSQYTRQLRSVGLLLWVLLSCLVQGLEDQNTLEKISDLTLDRGLKDRLALVAECLQATMGIQQKGVPKPTVHKVLQVLEENRPKWITMQLQRARKLCSGSVAAQEKGVAAAELTEQKIGLMLLEICHKAGGSGYLRQIYHIIRGNEEVLMSKLSVTADPVGDAPQMVNFDLGSEDHAAARLFNPLFQFDHISGKKLDQRALADWVWDWPGLLPAYQGMCQVTFTTLLANR